MILDIYFNKVRRVTVYQTNITHNLRDMAEAAGVYGVLWRPEENGIQAAGQLEEYLIKALDLLRADPERFREYDAPNGWGTYPDFVSWLEGLLRAVRENPDAEVEASR